MFKKYSTILEIATYILGLPPLAFTVSLLSFYLKAANTLGYYPTYNNPDPKLLSFYETYSQFILISGEIAIYSLFAWLFIIVLYSYTFRAKRLPILTGAALYISSLGIIFTEVMNWYGD